MRIEKYDLGNEEIAIPVAEGYRDCLTLIKSDLFRIEGRVVSTAFVVRRLLRPFRSSVLFWFRLSQHKRGLLYPLCRYMYDRACRRAQIQIPVTVKVGYGFYIGHDTCMVVNGRTVMGNNVNLSPFLNIGSNKRTPAIIGNNVYIGPNVSVVDDVRIGSGSTIGAGAVVTHDIPAGATAVGVPAREISHDSQASYIANPYPVELTILNQNIQ